jgi:hypothetical protein
MAARTKCLGCDQRIWKNLLCRDCHREYTAMRRRMVKLFAPTVRTPRVYAAREHGGHVTRKD